jgi:hypothetical protein
MKAIARGTLEGDEKRNLAPAILPSLNGAPAGRQWAMFSRRFGRRKDDL